MDGNPLIAFLARRRSTSALGLAAPAPGADELAQLLTIAARVPDHGKLVPWRFIVLEGEAKQRFVARLDALAASRPDSARLAPGLKKLDRPPLCVCVVSSPRESQIPAWEQQLSAGAVCMNLLTAALAMGYGANWLTEWVAYDSEALRLLGVTAQERIAAMVMIGTAAGQPEDRPRPDIAEIIARPAACDFE